MMCLNASSPFPCIECGENVWKKLALKCFDIELVTLKSFGPRPQFCIANYDVGIGVRLQGRD